MSEDNILMEEQLPQQSTVDQLKRIRKISKGTDIGDKISDMNKQGANINYIHNPIDTGILSYQKFTADNKKKFQTGLNVNHLKPFKDYMVPPTTVEKKKRKKS